MALELVDFQKGVCDGFIVVLRPEFGVQCSRSKALLPFSSCLLLREQWVGFWLLFISWRNRNSPDIGHVPVPMLNTLETSTLPRPVWSWLPQPWLSHSSQQHTQPPGNRMPLQTELYSPLAMYWAWLSFPGAKGVLVSLRKLFVFPRVAAVLLHTGAAEWECQMLLGYLRPNPVMS